MNSNIQTYSGLNFFPLAPRSQDISIVDIAHALSLICRFGGHCNSFYSVADHSLRVMDIVDNKFKLTALLHDASEAYLCDIPTPLKLFLKEYSKSEDYLMRLISDKYGLIWPLPKEVKEADAILLATEKRDLMIDNGIDWKLKQEPLPHILTPNSKCKDVEQKFLEEFNDKH